MGLSISETYKSKTRLTPYKLKVNDMVRVSHENAVFKRAYNEQFSKEIFKVAQRFRMQGIPMYKIKDFSNEPIKGNFYSSELKKVEKNEDALWIIDKKNRKRTVNCKVEFLVYFQGGRVNITPGFLKVISMT